MREDRQRLDKWLWFARFAKSRVGGEARRGAASSAINGERGDNAGKGVAVGDVLTVALPGRPWSCKVENSGSAAARRRRRQLYAEIGRDQPSLVTNGGKV